MINYKTMSSIQSALAQSNKRFVVGAGGGRIYDNTGNNPATLGTAGTILQDMGKTVYLNDANGNVLRKVKTMPFNSSSVTGYIYIAGVAPTLQNIATLF